MSVIDARKRARQRLVLQFCIGIVVVALTNVLEWKFALVPLPAALTWVVQCGIAGLIFTISSSNFIARKLAPFAALWQRVIVKSTLAFVVVLVTILFNVPNISYRWLVVFYALSIIWNWFTAYFFKENSIASQAGSRMVTGWNLSHVFALTSFVLLILTLGLTMAQQPIIANRTANWAYGFLSITVFLIVIDQFAWFKRFRILDPASLGAFIVLLFMAAYYPVFTSSTKAEATFEIDTRPNLLASQMTQADILISDSPQLRTSNLSNIPAHLDVRPDEQGIALWNDLMRALSGKRRVYWIRVPEYSNDTKHVLATFLQANGCLVDRQASGLHVDVYELRPPFVAPRVLPPSLALGNSDAFDPAQIDFGAIQITGSRIEPNACSHGALAVALRWRLTQPTESPLRASFLVIDPKGHAISTLDFYVDDTALRHTDQWSPGEETPSYYQIIVPFGTPPRTYRLALAVFPENNPQRLPIVGTHDDRVNLGQFQVYRAEDDTHDPYNSLRESNLTPAGIQLRDGLQLDAYGINKQVLLPGEKLTLTTRWKALGAPLLDYNIRVRLKSDQTLTETFGKNYDNSYPSSHWQSGESVVDRWVLSVPRTSPGGTARLEIAVDGGKSLHLADVDITPITRTLQMPKVDVSVRARFDNLAELVGYEIEKPNIAPEKPLRITLHWRAIAAIDENYTIFVQLVSKDDRLIAQSDQIPAKGDRPIWSWIPDEYVADRHELTLDSSDFQGEAKLIVGIYDTATKKRVLVNNGTTDFLSLPSSILVK
ncbi:MAG: hypothetical protein HZB51_27545 [Chloroflexi bacterium]|nr:hypothetical protein [Chloroflexota bacterium]